MFNASGNKCIREQNPDKQIVAYMSGVLAPSIRLYSS